jgi:hypothetical protein
MCPKLEDENLSEKFSTEMKFYKIDPWTWLPGLHSQLVATKKDAVLDSLLSDATDSSTESKI